MYTRKTKAGWVIRITNMVGDMLEQGGIQGRELLYSHSTLDEEGISYDADPHGLYAPGNPLSPTYAEYLYNYNCPCKILRRGSRIL